MTARWLATGALATVAMVLSGCRGPLHASVTESSSPRENLDFAALYHQNCAGCHGTEGKNGPAYPLANPEYQALVDDATLRTVIAQGDPGTLMPAFAISAGGTLTDHQVNALVSGMRAAWRKPQGPSKMPSYRPSGEGDPTRGQQIYSADCALCHGDPGHTEDSLAGSVLDPVFLSLTSDEVVRTVVIAGRPDLGMPDWKGSLPDGSPGHQEMTEQQVTDVVAWIASQRSGNGERAALEIQSKRKGGME